MKKKKETQMGNGCVVLFGLPFFLIGFILFCWGISMFYTWQRSGNWERIPARIMSAEIKTNYDSDGDTYSIKGSYRYNYKGKEYTSYKIEIETGSTSAYDEKHEMLEKMQHAIKNETTIDAYVNPDNPDEAILFRKISMGMIIVPCVGFLFSLVGLGIIIGGIRSYKDDQKKKVLLNKHPGRPWKADSRWRGFNITTSELGSLIAVWIFAAIFSLFVSVFIVAFLNDSNVSFIAWGIVSIFAMFALLIVYSAIHKTLAYFKYGESQMVLQQIPLVPGSEFKAVIILPKGIAPGTKIDLEFFCESCLTTGSGKHRSTKTSLLHKEKATKVTDRNKRINGRLIVPIEFLVPEDASPDSPLTNPSIEWKLKAVAEVPGVDYEATFPLPVFNVDKDEYIEYKS
jgi:hypothetical protein